MIKSIKDYPNGTVLVVEWADRHMVIGKIDTIYETDNGLDIGEEGYKEFYACLLKVEKILHCSKKEPNYLISDFIEISMQNTPSKISLKEGKTIWELK